MYCQELAAAAASAIDFSPWTEKSRCATIFFTLPTHLSVEIIGSPSNSNPTTFVLICCVITKDIFHYINCSSTRRWRTLKKRGKKETIFQSSVKIFLASRRTKCRSCSDRSELLFDAKREKNTRNSLSGQITRCLFRISMAFWSLLWLRNARWDVGALMSSAWSSFSHRNLTPAHAPTC